MTGRHEIPSDQVATVELTDGETVVGELPAAAIIGNVKAVEGAVTASQVTYPWKATTRSLVQFLLTAAALYPAIVGAIGEVPGWLAPILAGGALVAAAITRIMAIPAVNLWLAKVGLSAQPKAVTVQAARSAEGN